VPYGAETEGMNERPWDENDLTDEELLRMWEEGEPVPILQTQMEIQPPHVHHPDSATLGREGGRSQNLRLGWPLPTNPALRESVNTGAAAA
jgi:hypothetical protein